jgi:hypothetical protein
MRRYSRSNPFLTKSLKGLVPFLGLMTALQSFGAGMSIHYTLTAKSGVTPVPGSAGTFTNIDSLPSPAFLKGFDHAQIQQFKHK